MFLPHVACPCDCIKLHSQELYLGDLSYPSEYKLSEALNKVDYCMRLLADYSFISSILPGSTTTSVVTTYNELLFCPKGE